MKVFVKYGATLGKVGYIHAFTSESTNSHGYIEVKDSILRVGRPGAYFTKPGETVFWDLKHRKESLARLPTS